MEISGGGGGGLRLMEVHWNNPRTESNPTGEK